MGALNAHASQVRVQIFSFCRCHNGFFFQIVRRSFSPWNCLEYLLLLFHIFELSITLMECESSLHINSYLIDRLGLFLNFHIVEKFLIILLVRFKNLHNHVEKS